MKFVVSLPLNTVQGNRRAAAVLRPWAEAKRTLPKVSSVSYWSSMASHNSLEPVGQLDEVSQLACSGETLSRFSNRAVFNCCTDSVLVFSCATSYPRCLTRKDTVDCETPKTLATAACFCRSSSISTIWSLCTRARHVMMFYLSL